MRKLWEVFSFDLSSQARRFSTWLYFPVLLLITWQLATEAYIPKARAGGYFFNSPFIIAEVTLLGSLMALLAAAALAGDAGARDIQTRMHPLVYTAPVGRGAYLGGRFLAAFVLNALILLAVPAALLLAALVPGPEAELIGPFRPAAYLGPFFMFALPNAFVATALFFSAAALSRRAMAGYVGAVLLFFAGMTSWIVLAMQLGWWKLATRVDPLGLTVLGELSKTRTPLQKGTRLIALEGSLLANRLVWVGIALAVLALTYLRFRFAHPVERTWRRARGAARAEAPARSAPITVPEVPMGFGGGARARQALEVAIHSFREVVMSWGGVALAAMAVLLVMTAPAQMEHLGIPLHPTTAYVTGFIAAPLANPGDLFWMIVPLFIVYSAGELVWRERDAGMSDIADAAPVPDWVMLAGKLAGLGLALVALQALIMASGMLIQALLGYHHFEPGVYARVLFGFQLADYLLFAVLVFVVHVVANQKYVGHMVALLAYASMAFASAMGIEHGMLVYGSDPGWTYSDLRGFGPFMAPYLWFKLYWAAWALLLAVAARLLWVRGREPGAGARLRAARRRLTRPVAGAAALAAGLVLALGGFVFYNTNVLNEYRTASDLTELRAGYERRYGRYEGIAQPALAGTRLDVEIHPRRREVEIHGSYRLVNRSAAAIDSIHLTTDVGVEMGAVGFDRPATRALADTRLGYRIYALAQPLRPGDSLRLTFQLRRRPRGFQKGALDASVAEKASFIRLPEWLPSVGYQADREVSGAGERRARGLPSRPDTRSLYDEGAGDQGAERISLEAVVGTDGDQVAVAPGALKRTWTQGGRRYFHYATDVPIRNDYALFSARYAVREGRWNDVAIQVFHHPGHAWNADRIIRGVGAALDYQTRNFGPYPHHQIRFVEYAQDGHALHSAPVNIWYKEGFSLWNPEADPRDVDFPFAVVAHEVAHQWWGNQLTPAPVEGAPVLTESLAWYSAMGVMETTYGRARLGRFMDVMRLEYLSPRTRAAVPLLRANDWFHGYRKGPFAMYALREYLGEERVNAALRRLLARHGSGAPPLPTSLHLYRELQSATPDSLRYLLADLFTANTYWELATERATVEPAGAGTWRVTLDVKARKVVVDTADVEREVPMNDLVELGVLPAAANGEPLYQRLHRIRSGRQRITLIVKGQPARAGIDPRSLLIDVNTADNVREVVPRR
ncbi:MAG TPA: M1 family aminopeptidase [Longimicrobium sp.]|jgi:ABC-type transport system involved in multi-copper enzyme maturation permease subunit